MNDANNVLYLLPPAVNRVNMFKSVLQGSPCAERYLFYGMDYFALKGVNIVHNLKPANRLFRYAGDVFRFAVTRGLKSYSGDIEWLLPVLRYLDRVDGIVAYSDRIIMPLLYLRMSGVIKRRPTLYIPMGLPEKLRNISNRNMLNKIISELKRIECIASVSMPEVEVLKNDYGLTENVRYVKVGVDTDYFAPFAAEETIDVLSIGGDPFRDYGTFVKVAASLPKIRFRLITRKHLIDNPGSLPKNIDLAFDVPMSTIKTEIACAKALYLPVKENLYSGGTTVLLQAMAMGKAVVANPVGPNKEGYGFRDRDNLMFVSCGDAEGAITTIKDLIYNPELRQAVGSSARSHVQNGLSLNLFHDEIYQIFKQISAC